MATPQHRALIDAAVAANRAPTLRGNSLQFGNIRLKTLDKDPTHAGRYYLQKLEQRLGPQGPLEGLDHFPANAVPTVRNGVETVQDRAGVPRITRRWAGRRRPQVHPSRPRLGPQHDPLHREGARHQGGPGRGR